MRLMWWYGWLQFEVWILEDAIRLGGSVTLAMSEWKLYWIEKPDEKVWSSVSCMASAWMTVLGLEVESETGQITSVQCEECDYQLKCNSLLRVVGRNSQRGRSLKRCYRRYQGKRFYQRFFKQIKIVVCKWVINWEGA